MMISAQNRHASDVVRTCHDLTIIFGPSRLAIIDVHGLTSKLFHFVPPHASTSTVCTAAMSNFQAFLFKALQHVSPIAWPVFSAQTP